MAKYSPLLLLLFFTITLAAAQPADTVLIKNDTIHNDKVNNQLNSVKQLSAERVADSLKRNELELKVARLSGNDDERLGLVKQLNALKQKDSLRIIRQKQQVDSLRRYVKGFAVQPFRDTLFSIYLKQGSFTAKDRAEAVQHRLILLADNYRFSADSLKISEAEQTTDIVYGDELIMSVSDMDALWQNTSRSKLAQKLRATIGHAVVINRDETSIQTLVKEGLLALLVIAVLSLLIYFINRLFRWFTGKLALNERVSKKGVHIRNYQLLTPARQLGLINTAIGLVRWVVILITVYFALTILFSIFPFTRDISAALLGYILSPLRKIGEAIWNYIPNLITIIILVVVFRYVLRFFNFIKLEIERGQLTIPGFYADWANPTYQIIRVLVLAFMIVVIFPYLPGNESPIFKGVSVFVGVLFTFGSAGALGNVVAGLVLTYMRAFKIGDRVKIGEVTGDIIEKNLLVTRIRTIQNEIISIPNSTVMSNHTVNYSSDATHKGLIVHTTVTCGYDVAWREVHKLLIEAASRTPLLEKEPLPYVFQTSLDDFYVSYRINAFTKSPNKQALIYSDLHANIQDVFNEAGIELMSPRYNAVRDGNTTAIPAEYLPKDYQPGGIRIKKDDL
ncbi:mechanosensitive ion channel family protein [Mucilaginibacter sp. UR6-1]|uniref:mechanosensitive ion channel family protein n=1 Tax=Mucilaginibacter sp. UR6-1 TaxID=1435643 RepID=UPI001E470C9D|nr:mechanosensitive ion channel family protein [Mucilaginibacter sp. UR6-1]MCC8408033.1 mechanosensitive ion channel family protein [Mucilaginibacter sp. UR6-1]